MKRQIFILMALMAIAGFVYAQKSRTATGSSGSNDMSCVVTTMTADGGCDIVFDMQARERSSGQATGKRQHSPIRYMVSSSDNSATEVKSPRDASSGQASGKSVAGSPIGGLSIKGGKNPGGNQFNKIVVQDGSFTLPDDCPEGEYTLIMSWSWGANQQGTSTSGGGAGRGKISFTVSKTATGWDLATLKKA